MLPVVLLCPAEDGIRDRSPFRGLGVVYKSQGVRDVQADGGDLKVFVTGRTINVFTSESGAIYTVDGTCVSEFEGTVHETVRPGIYIVRADGMVKKVLVK